jgi:hypothetical protein
MVAGEMTAGLAYIELSKFKPPMEFELAFVVPDDSVPWNFYHSLSLTDENGKIHDWSPGMQNIPGKGRNYINSSPDNAFHVKQSSEINIRFDRPIPQSVLTQKPLRMLLQVIDDHSLRVGFRGRQEGAVWYWSEIFDTSKVFGKIAKFQLPCVVSYVLDGSGVGNYPHPQQLLIDYVHYSYGQTQ